MAGRQSTLADSTRLSATRRGRRSSSKRWSGSRFAGPSLLVASTAAARRAGLEQLRVAGDPLVRDFDEAKERSDSLSKSRSRVGAVSTAWPRRHQPVLAVRGAGDGVGEAERTRGTANTVRHLRGQDGGALLQVSFHKWEAVWDIRL